MCCGCVCGLFEDFLEAPPSVFLFLCFYFYIFYIYMALRRVLLFGILLWRFEAVGFFISLFSHRTFQERRCTALCLARPWSVGPHFLVAQGAGRAPESTVHATATRSYSYAFRAPSSICCVLRTVQCTVNLPNLSSHHVGTSISLGVSPPRFALFLYLKPRVLSRL